MAFDSDHPVWESRCYVSPPGSGGLESAESAVLEALVDDLDVPRALDIAIEDGGQAALDLTAVLAL